MDMKVYNELKLKDKLIDDKHNYDREEMRGNKNFIKIFRQI
jgi:hypothetical protein